MGLATLLVMLLLFACTPDPIDTADSADTADSGDTAEPGACDCDAEGNVILSVTESGGFDDWSGAALAWAVDETNGRLMVAAMEYELGVGTIDIVPACDDPDLLAGSWIVDVPPSQRDAAERYPLLAAALTTAAGVRSLTEDVGVVFLEGDLQSSTPDRAFIATGGEATLLRQEGYDELQGAFAFTAAITAPGGDATDACDEGFRLAAIDLDFESGGSE